MTTDLAGRRADARPRSPPKGVAGFYVDGTLNELKVKTVGSRVDDLV